MDSSHYIKVTVWPTDVIVAVSLQKFEELFCEYTGAKYCTTVSNCTAGLHLSCLAAGFSKGDEVIVPAQTHTATSHAVELTGAKTVFADVDYKTANISITDIKNKTKVPLGP